MSNQQGGRGAASPVVVFLCLLAVVALVAVGVIWAGQTDQQPIPPAPVETPRPTEDHTLTDAEAVARFKELDALRVIAFEGKRLGMLDKIFTADSPARERLEASIRQLDRDKAAAQVKSKILQREVTRNLPRKVVLEEVVLYDLKFVDADGRDITQSGGLERQRVRWTLRLESDEWLLHNGVIVHARPARA